MQEQVPNDVMQPQEVQRVIESQVQSASPRIWRWLAGGALGATLAVTSLGYWYWNVTTFNEPADEANNWRVPVYDAQGNLSIYEKDSEHVYAYGEPIDFSEWAQSISLDPSSFRAIDNIFSTDGKYVFSRLGQKFSSIVKDADPSTFRSDGLIARDDNHVWIVDTLLEEPVSGADPTTFQAVGLSNNPYLSLHYFKDKHKVYYQTQDHMTANAAAIESADPVTFEVVDGKVYYDAQDQNYRYLQGEIVGDSASGTVYKKIFSSPQYSFYCRLRTGTESNCTLFAKQVGSQEYIALGLVLDYGSYDSGGVLVSPDNNYMLVILETKAVLIDVATLQQQTAIMVNDDERLGTYTEFPSFQPKAKWVDNEHIQFSIYPPGLEIQGVETKDIRMIDIRGLL